jgi:hypothetical protein
MRQPGLYFVQIYKICAVGMAFYAQEGTDSFMSSLFLQDYGEKKET